MQDRAATYPGRVKLIPVSGQANTYDLTRADSPTATGTPLNKANLLADATAALFGGNSSSTPNNILSAISPLVMRFGTCSTAAATTAKTVSVTGSFSLVTGLCVRVLFTNTNTAASPTLNVNSTGAKAIRKTSGTAVDPKAWGAGSVVDFVYNGSVWIMLTALSQPKAQVVSYVGTGTYGSSNPTSITFDFNPIVCFYLGYKSRWVYSGVTNYEWADHDDKIPSVVYVSEIPNTYTPKQPSSYIAIQNFKNSSTVYIKYDSSTRTLSWYSTSSAGDQLNDIRGTGDYTYYILGIGG